VWVTTRGIAQVLKERGPKDPKEHTENARPVTESDDDDCPRYAPTPLPHSSSALALLESKKGDQTIL